MIDIVDNWPSQQADLARVPTAVLYNDEGQVGAAPAPHNWKSLRRVTDTMPRLQATFFWRRCQGRPDI